MRKKRCVLVVGAGDVALRALPWLTRRFRVLALARERDAETLRRWREGGARVLAGDLDDRASVRRVAGVADAVLYLAPPPASGEGDPRMRNFLAALGRGSLPRTMAVVSTTGVYGDCAGRVVDETQKVRPQTARGRRRADAERRARRLVRRGVGVRILRAPGIYALERLPVVRLYEGVPAVRAEEDGFSNHIHADDLAQAVCLALFRGGTGRVMNVADGVAVQSGAFFDAVADALGLTRPPRLPRAEVLAQVSPMRASFLRESRRLDTKRLQEELRVRLRHPDVLAFLAALSPADVAAALTDCRR